MRGVRARSQSRLPSCGPELAGRWAPARRFAGIPQRRNEAGVSLVVPSSRMAAPRSESLAGRGGAGARAPRAVL
jgi:hypothetical protein